MEDRQGVRVLVAFATRSGATADVARAVADRLSERGGRVDVRRVQDVTECSPYGLVVVGSAVRMGRWLPAAVRFVEQHVAALRLVPTAFFTVHMLNIDDSVGSIQRRRAYLDPVRATFTPDHEAYFAGRMALDHLGTMDRLIARLVKARDGDLRHWRAIRDWADEITIPPPAT